MNKAKMYTALSGTCLLIGLGGIAGACETGKGFFLSALIFSIGFVSAYRSES